MEKSSKFLNLIGIGLFFVSLFFLSSYVFNFNFNLIGNSYAYELPTGYGLGCDLGFETQNAPWCTDFNSSTGGSTTTTSTTTSTAVTTNLKASATSVNLNGKVTLTWTSTNATHCYLRDNWGKQYSTALNNSVGLLSDSLKKNTTFTLTCDNAPVTWSGDKYKIVTGDYRPADIYDNQEGTFTVGYTNCYNLSKSISYSSNTTNYLCVLGNSPTPVETGGNTAGTITLKEACSCPSGN